MKPTKEYNGRSRIRMYNCDCMELMKKGSWDLAIVDPPYKDEFKISANSKCAKVNKDYNLTSLNSNSPDDKYFSILKCISENQIIWGVNYYKTYLGAGRIVWDKNNTGVYSDCELAFHSFSDVTRKYKFTWNGMLQEDMKNKEHRIHPTQKPAQLYKWLLTNYAKEGDTILDTHGGSLSIAIACWDLGFDLDVCELDTDYFNDAVKRFENHISQGQLF